MGAVYQLSLRQLAGRWRLLIMTVLAAITVAAPFIAASAFISASVAFLGDARAIAAVTLSAVVGVALYAAAFVWLGLVSTQAIGVGLLYIVLWEGFLSKYVSGVRLLSIRHYAIALMNGLDERRFASAAHPSMEAAIALSVVVFTGFLLLSVRRLRRMDVP